MAREKQPPHWEHVLLEFLQPDFLWAIRERDRKGPRMPPKKTREMTQGFPAYVSESNAKELRSLNPHIHKASSGI